MEVYIRRMMAMTTPGLSCIENKEERPTWFVVALKVERMQWANANRDPCNAGAH